MKIDLIMISYILLLISCISMLIFLITGIEVFYFTAFILLAPVMVYAIFKEVNK